MFPRFVTLPVVVKEFSPNLSFRTYPFLVFVRLFDSSRGATVQDSGRSWQVFRSALVGELVGDKKDVDGAGEGKELGLLV